MTSPRIAGLGAGARSRARAKRPKAVPCAARTPAHGSRPGRPWPGRFLGPRAGATRRRAWSEEHSDEGARTAAARAPGRRGSASASAPRRRRRVPLKNGLARRSPAPTPGRGAQLASTEDVCGGALASDVIRPCSDRAARAPHDLGGVGLTSLGRRARRSERQRSGGDAPEARGAGAQQRGALHFSRRQPNGHWAAGRCTARDRGRSEEGPLARAVLAPVPSSPRAPEPTWAPFVPRRPQAPCGPLLRAGSSWIRTTRSRPGIALTSARSGSTTRTTTPRTSTKGRRLRLRAEGRWSAALHGSRRRGPPPLAVTPRESPARRVPAAEGGLRATPHRGRSQAKPSLA